MDAQQNLSNRVVRDCLAVGHFHFPLDRSALSCGHQKSAHGTISNMALPPRCAASLRLAGKALPTPRSTTAIWSETGQWGFAFGRSETCRASEWQSHSLITPVCPPNGFDAHRLCSHSKTRSFVTSRAILKIQITTKRSSAIVTGRTGPVPCGEVFQRTRRIYLSPLRQSRLVVVAS